MSKPKLTAGTTSAYTEHYIQSLFHIWYDAGRTDKWAEIEELVPEDEFGRKPSRAAVMRWRNERSWDARADELDAKAEAIVEDEMVNRRVLMLKEQASAGKELRTKGMDYLRERGFDTSSSAVTAIIRGAELEKTSLGISERLEKMVTLSDDRLTEEVQKLIDEASESDEIIDMDDIIKEEDTDAEDS